MRAILLVTAFVCVGAAGNLPADAQAELDSVVASFEGHDLRLAEDWGDAGACYQDAVDTRCYRTEAEMDATESVVRRTQAAPLASCSTTLRLYRSTNYGGGVLALSQRGTGIALSTFGFNNDTSSFRIGACSAIFYDGGVGSTQYSGGTAAGVWSAFMVSGWDNRVSTVYIQ
ncbi:MAG: hypothetical protein M3451_07880 [Chloroflexota bacterium]|nr:hypothetical protein [Chloroflexota bacterium]